ncbi:MAG: hypothetical protein M1817_001527 [Caeruleum heppii]|nr:MAG: hypothetical protein M1817_001527 [Caeruleum heppii]
MTPSFDSLTTRSGFPADMPASVTPGSVASRVRAFNSRASESASASAKDRFRGSCTSEGSSFSQGHRMVRRGLDIFDHPPPPPEKDREINGAMAEAVATRVRGRLPSAVIRPWESNPVLSRAADGSSMLGSKRDASLQGRDAREISDRSSECSSAPLVPSKGDSHINGVSPISQKQLLNGTAVRQSQRNASSAPEPTSSLLDIHRSTSDLIPRNPSDKDAPLTKARQSTPPTTTSQGKFHIWRRRGRETSASPLCTPVPHNSEDGVIIAPEPTPPAPLPAGPCEHQRCHICQQSGPVHFLCSGCCERLSKWTKGRQTSKSDGFRISTSNLRPSLEKKEKKARSSLTSQGHRTLSGRSASEASLRALLRRDQSRLSLASSNNTKGVPTSRKSSWGSLASGWRVKSGGSRTQSRILNFFRRRSTKGTNLSIEEEAPATSTVPEEIIAENVIDSDRTTPVLVEIALCAPETPKAEGKPLADESPSSPIAATTPTDLAVPKTRRQSVFKEHLGSCDTTDGPSAIKPPPPESITPPDPSQPLPEHQVFYRRADGRVTSRKLPSARSSRSTSGAGQTDGTTQRKMSTVAGIMTPKTVEKILEEDRTRKIRISLPEGLMHSRLTGVTMRLRFAEREEPFVVTAGFEDEQLVVVAVEEEKGE